jgi:hypothetical protein
MKKLCILASLVGMAVAPSLVADQIQVGYAGSGYGPYQTGQGGEFTLKPDAGLQWVLNVYDTKAKNQGLEGTFQSFCLERQEYLWPYPAIYDAVLSDKATYGGNYPNGDPLSVGTAWLYHQFSSGMLEGYNYTGDRWAKAGPLQNTIWWLEGETDDPGAGNFYRSLVVNQFGTIEAAMADNFKNGQRQIPVMVLNLWEPGHIGDPNYARQDVLVDPPSVPDGGNTVLLLGLALGGLAMIRRRVA